MLERIAILGTGLIGASAGLALRAHGFSGSITGWDPNLQELHTALARGAITVMADDPEMAAAQANLTLLAGPVFTIIEWLDRLAPLLRDDQCVTDVGSVKSAICHRASDQYNGPGRPAFLPGHPMAGKEVGGAAHADATLFDGSIWLFTPCHRAEGSSPAPREGALSPESNGPAGQAWRSWVARFGARLVDLDPARHDLLCAWISHLPQMVSTALSALLEDEFAAHADLLPIGGRALREMTRLGSSPFSMWRDIAHTNTDAIAHSLQALEQRLAHLRENLKTPELREEFERANRFRLRNPGRP